MPAIFHSLKIKCSTLCIHLHDYHIWHNNSVTSNNLIDKLHVKKKKKSYISSEKSQKNNAEVTHVNLVKWFLKDEKKSLFMKEDTSHASGYCRLEFVIFVHF